MKNDWFNLEKFMVEGIPDLPEARNLAETMSHEEIVARELHKGEDLDASIHSYSTSGRWPLLDREESYLIQERIKFGCFIAKVLQTQDPMSSDPQRSWCPAPPAEFSIPEQVQWLLIAAWNAVGRTAWATGKF